MPVYCSQELLARVADGQDLSGEAVAVTKQVFASPSSTHVNLEAGKAETEPQPAYPDIHFSGAGWCGVVLVLARVSEGTGQGTGCSAKPGTRCGLYLFATRLLTPLCEVDC